jgi:hypothetical protein
MRTRHGTRVHKPEREPTMHRSKSHRDSFAHFYLTRVALGEGCGCAEQAMRLREIEGRLHARPIETRRTAWPLRALLARLVASLGRRHPGST